MIYEIKKVKFDLDDVANVTSENFLLTIHLKSGAMISVQYTSKDEENVAYEKLVQALTKHKEELDMLIRSLTSI